MNVNFKVLALALFFSPLVQASVVVNCKVSEVVDNSYFDDKLSVDEEVVVTKDDATNELAVKVGIVEFNSEFGDIITPQNTIGFDKAFQIRLANSPDVLSLFVNGRSGKGTITVSDSIVEKNKKLLYNLNCQ